MNKVHCNEISHFVKALILIVLVQTSSCSVERVFSQLQFIQRACGCGMLEATLELCTKLRFQHGKGNDYDFDKEN